MLCVWLQKLLSPEYHTYQVYCSVYLVVATLRARYKTHSVVEHVTERASILTTARRTMFSRQWSIGNFAVVLQISGVDFGPWVARLSPTIVFLTGLLNHCNSGATQPLHLWIRHVIYTILREIPTPHRIICHASVAPTPTIFTLNRAGTGVLAFRWRFQGMENRVVSPWASPMCLHRQPCQTKPRGSSWVTVFPAGLNRCVES